MAVRNVDECVGVGKAEFGVFVYVLTHSRLIADDLCGLGGGSEFGMHVEEVDIELFTSVRVCPDNRTLIFVKRQVPVRPCMYLFAFARDATCEGEFSTIAKFD